MMLIWFNTIVAKVETKIESITLYSNDTVVIWICVNLDKIGLSRYDLDQDIFLIDMTLNQSDLKMIFDS
jgi:hypothetical protein